MYVEIDSNNRYLQEISNDDIVKGKPITIMIYNIIFIIATTETVGTLLATSEQKIERIEKQMEQMVALSSHALEEPDGKSQQLMEDMKLELKKLYQINEVK